MLYVPMAVFLKHKKKNIHVLLIAMLLTLGLLKWGALNQMAKCKEFQSRDPPQPLTEGWKIFFPVEAFSKHSSTFMDRLQFFPCLRGNLKKKVKLVPLLSDNNLFNKTIRVVRTTGLELFFGLLVYAAVLSFFLHLEVLILVHLGRPDLDMMALENNHERVLRRRDDALVGGANDGALQPALQPVPHVDDGGNFRSFVENMLGGLMSGFTWIAHAAALNGHHEIPVPAGDDTTVQENSQQASNPKEGVMPRIIEKGDRCAICHGCLVKNDYLCHGNHQDISNAEHVEPSIKVNRVSLKDHYLVYCRRQCGKSVHLSCMAEWGRACVGEMNKPSATCVYCGSPWWIEENESSMDSMSSIDAEIEAGFALRRLAHHDENYPPRWPNVLWHVYV